MKKTILVVLIACAMLAMMVGVAFAEGLGIGSYPDTAETGHTWGAVDDGFYFSGTGNPHGGFTEATHNCTVCHSVHHAVSDGEALLPADVVDACTYCHIAPGTAGYISLYNQNTANYTDASDNGHNATLTGVACTDCHQVHAASRQMVSDKYGTMGAGTDYLVTKILKVDGTGSDLWNVAGGHLSFDGTEDSGTAVSMWCTSCHGGSSLSYGYFNTGYGTATHVMKDPTTDYTSSSGEIGKIATATSKYCSDCHNQADRDQSPTDASLVNSVYNFPHWSDGNRFLTAATGLDANGLPSGAGPATDAHADGVCINCHRGADLAGSGAGIGF